jgi:hypothetical protein
MPSGPKTTSRTTLNSVEKNRNYSTNSKNSRKPESLKERKLRRMMNSTAWSRKTTLGRKSRVKTKRRKKQSYLEEKKKMKASLQNIKIKHIFIDAPFSNAHSVWKKTKNLPKRCLSSTSTCHLRCTLESGSNDQLPSCWRSADEQFETGHERLQGLPLPI